MSNSICIVMVGYKDKNIVDAAKSIKNVTKTNNVLFVFDQHPLTHEREFDGIDQCVYEHKIWDDMHGPAYRRSEKIFDNMDNFSHVCVVSPDITLSDGWDLNLIDLADRTDVVFSGSGKVSVSQKDLFSLSISYDEDKKFNKTQMVDRNFIFAKSDAFKKIVMPDFLKYAGENEYLSVSFLSAGYDIMSLPHNMYTDNQARSLENTYHTFSAEHNYNVVIDLLNGIKLDRYKLNRAGLNKFLEFHSIAPGSIKKLPYQTNDVSYDPYMMKMHDIDGRRFIMDTKAVY